VALIKHISLAFLITNPQDLICQKTTIFINDALKFSNVTRRFCFLSVIISSSCLNIFKGKDTEQKERILPHWCLIRE